MEESGWNDELIEKFAEQVRDSAFHNRDGAISWQRWAMASCLSVNGGAAIAVLNMRDINSASQFWAVFWFVCGIVCTIIYGFAAANLMARFSGYFLTSSWKMTKLSKGVEAGSKLDITEFDRLNKLDDRIQWLQYLALLIFVVGLVITVEGM